MVRVETSKNLHAHPLKLQLDGRITSPTGRSCIVVSLSAALDVCDPFLRECESGIGIIDGLCDDGIGFTVH